MFGKDMYKRMLTLPFVTLFACGACSFSTTHTTKPSASPTASTTSVLPSSSSPATEGDPSEQQDDSSEAIRIPSAPGLSYHKSIYGSKYLVPKIQGCSEEKIHVALRPDETKEVGKDYILSVENRDENDCYITTMDVYLTAGESRLLPLLDHEGGHFIPLVIEYWGKARYEAKIHFNIETTLNCKDIKATNIELIINRYIKVHSYSTNFPHICRQQAHGQKTISPFMRIANEP